MRAEFIRKLICYRELFRKPIGFASQLAVEIYRLPDVIGHLLIGHLIFQSLLMSIGTLMIQQTLARTQRKLAWL
jgi:hypothetical protein